MECEQALEIIASMVYDATGQSLTTVQRVILEGVWQGQSYQEMSELSGGQYSLNYLQNAAGRDLWKLLRKVLSTPTLNKRNFRVLMEALPPERITTPPLEPELEVLTSSSIQKSGKTIIATHSPLNTAGGGDRDQEIQALKVLILDDSCRCLFITGLPGIGKTCLATLFTEDPEVLHEFSGGIIWRSLQYAPSLTDLLNSLPQTLLPNSELSVNTVLPRLLQSLRDSRFLLVLDGMESLFQKGQLAGRFCKQNEDYRELLHSICELPHESCFLITSQECPLGMNQMDLKNSWVHFYTLSGLSTTASLKLVGADDQGKAYPQATQLIPICHRYQGHPVALKQIAQILSQLFNRNIDEFLSRDIPIYGTLRHQLTTWFSRLSEWEREVLYWLAEAPHALPFNTLKTQLDIADGPLLEILASLQQRSVLIPQSVLGTAGFELQPFIRQYLISTPGEPLEVELDLKPTPVHLTPWFRDSVSDRQDSGWYPIDRLYKQRSIAKIAPRLRSASSLNHGFVVKRFKPIELGAMAVGLSQNTTILLVIAITPEDQKVRIRVQVQPWEDESSAKTTLPDGIELTLLDQEEQSLCTICSQQNADFMQLPQFRGQREEAFSLKLTFDSVSNVNRFII